MFMNFSFVISVALVAIPAVAFHAGVDKEVRTSALWNSVSATGDYFNNLGTATRNSGGLPDFSLMKAPKPPAPLVPANGEEFFGGFVDEATVLATWDFPFTPEELVDMAKHFYHPDVLVGLADGGACLADDFEFCGSVVGPVGKDGYIQALTGFGLDKSFEIVGNIYGFYADPLQPGRVWYFNRSRAKQIAPFLGAVPTEKELEFPPQMNFIDFNTVGKVKQHGFYTIDRRQGNTGGIGGIYGYMYAVGRAPPFPEARPFKPSFRYRAFNFVLSIFYNLKKNKAASTINGSVNGSLDGIKY
jgi:hypothetical protein